MAQRIVDLLQAIQICVNDGRDLFVEAYLCQALIRDRQEPATIVKTRQFVNQRQALQRGFSPLAFSDVLNLKNKMRRLLIRIAHQRDAAEGPDDLPQTMHVTLFDLTVWSFSLHQTIKI